MYYAIDFYVFSIVCTTYATLINFIIILLWPKLTGTSKKKKTKQQKKKKQVNKPHLAGTVRPHVILSKMPQCQACMQLHTTVTWLQHIHASVPRLPGSIMQAFGCSITVSVPGDHSLTPRLRLEFACWSSQYLPSPVLIWAKVFNCHY